MVQARSSQEPGLKASPRALSFRVAVVVSGLFEKRYRFVMTAPRRCGWCRGGW
jgi:hypothetical protein